MRSPLMLYILVCIQFYSNFGIYPTHNNIMNVSCSNVELATYSISSETLFTEIKAKQCAPYLPSRPDHTMKNAERRSEVQSRGKKNYDNYNNSNNNNPK